MDPLGSPFRTWTVSCETNHRGESAAAAAAAAEVDVNGGKVNVYPADRPKARELE